MRDGHILLGKRKSSYRDNLWCIPCGHLDTLEPVMDGAKRELYSVYYIAKSVTGNLEANDDLSEVKYYALDDLPNMALKSEWHER